MKRLLARFQLIFDFISFYWQADTIYTQDSPTLYSFCQDVLNLENIHNTPITDQYRSRAKANDKMIELAQIGAYSQIYQSKKRRISQIANSSSSDKMKCDLLLNLAKWSDTNKVLELGTNLGILASTFAEHGIHVTTIEGDIALHQYASAHLAQFNNCTSIHDLFEDYLDQSQDEYDMIIIDGNHTYEATIHLLSKIKSRCTDNAIIIVDDIRWSKGMKRAWSEICLDHDFTLVIDLFMIGVLSAKKNLKSPLKSKLIPAKFKPWPYHFFRT